ncbi:MAG: M48 family metallopeptidase [Candidatus Sericytochromatia bacterium]
MDLFAQQARNRRMTWLLMGGFVLILAALGLVFQMWMDLRYEELPVVWLGAVAFSLAYAGIGYWRGDKLVLGSLGGRPADPAVLKEQQLMNVVEEMCLASGVPIPAVYILPDADPNALATGRDPAHATIAVTEGLLEALNREELQAVVAHEIGHIKNLDIRIMMVTSIFLGAIALIADMFMRQNRSSSSSRSKSNDGLLLVLIGLAATLAARFLAMAVSRTREFEADRSASEFTRNPQALASALRKLEAHHAPTQVATQGTAHLFVVDPRLSQLNDREDWLGDLFSTHPPIQQRIARLEQMGYSGLETAS